MGQMAAAITHELSQPLSAINSYLGGIARLLSDFAAPQNVAVALGKAREQTSRAGEIMRRLRDFAVRRESDLRVENIDEIVEQILKLALVDAAVRGVTARVQFAPGVKSILADKIQIGQVILNIARNAIEAMEEHFSERILTISTEIDDLSQEVVVRISDTGPGLAPEVKERLFQPFVTTKDKGMGIGLSICHGIVQSHGGMLSVEPNEPNGTTFVVRLPRAH
jgi:two-component system sensor kinase FixL